MITRKVLEEMAHKFWMKTEFDGDDIATSASYIAGFLAAIPIIFEAAREEMLRSGYGNDGYGPKYPTPESILEALKS